MLHAIWFAIAIFVAAAMDDMSMLQEKAPPEDSQVRLKVPAGATVVIAELGDDVLAPALRHHKHHHHRAKEAQAEAEKAPMTMSVPVLASAGHAQVQLRTRSEADKTVATAEESIVEKADAPFSVKDAISRGQLIMEARRSADIANAAAKAAEAALVSGTKLEAARAAKEAEEAAETAQRTAAKAQEEQKVLFSKLIHAAEAKKKNTTNVTLISATAVNATAPKGNASYGARMWANGVKGKKGVNNPAWNAKGKKFSPEDIHEPGFCCRYNMMNNCEACGLLFRASANSTCGRNRYTCEKKCGFNSKNPKWCPPPGTTVNSTVKK